MQKSWWLSSSIEKPRSLPGVQDQWGSLQKSSYASDVSWRLFTYTQHVNRLTRHILKENVVLWLLDKTWLPLFPLPRWPQLNIRHLSSTGFVFLSNLPSTNICIGLYSTLIQIKSEEGYKDSASLANKMKSVLISPRLPRTALHTVCVGLLAACNQLY